MKICPVCQKQFEESLNFCPVDGEVLDIDKSSLIGTVLDGQYQIDALLGEGGMGTVYRARHILLGDNVAIKILSGNFNNDPESLRRFLREGQTARRFRHPNVVSVHDLRTMPDGTAYMVMEHILGQTLKEVLEERGPFSVKEALETINPIADALNSAHDLGIVHRDLKPENIMFGKTNDGQAVIKLLDLGIAKVFNDRITAATRNDQILGTPGYMSPEQWGSKPKDGGPKIDNRADIYSLAIVIYELISGRLPFDGDSLHEIASQHLFSPAPLLHEEKSNVSSAFSEVLAKAMSKDRSLRPATCLDFIQELTAATFSTNPLAPQVNNTTETEAEAETAKIQAGVAITGAKIVPTEVKLGIDVKVDLKDFDTELVTVDATGQIMNRRCIQNQSFLQELPNNLALEMVWVSEGSFLMGSSETELKRSKDEDPQHLVKLPAFFISKYPVTQAQWYAVSLLPTISRPLNPDPSNFKDENRPVENVSWEDCQEFCLRLSQQTGRSYSLPSEAQWEYAARAGTTTAFHFGETITTDLANYNGLFRYGAGPRGINRNETLAVGSLGVANNFGLYDMHGNVWEWCQDAWHDNYIGAPTDGSAWETDAADNRKVMRGGSWYSQSNLCRSAARAGSWPNGNNDFLGFRVILNISSVIKLGNTANLTLQWPYKTKY
jgi:formylglycine-generating enzyme required for sulfatase activity